MKLNSKISIIIPVLLIVAAIAFAGCTGTGTGTAAPTQTTAPTASPVQTTSAEQITLTVFTAASLTGAFTDVGEKYMAENENVNVENVFDGSQALRTQIEQGAQPDIFVSANQKHMNALVDEGYMDNDTVQLFLENSLAVIVPADNPAKIQNLSDLANSGVKIVMGTKDVPFGSYTRQILGKMANSSEYGQDYVDAVYGNVISEETSVSTVVPKLLLGEADAAFVYKSDVSKDYGDKIIQIEIPEEYNVLAKYPLGILADSKQKDEAEDFIEFVRGDEGSAILKSYGFDPIPE
ncbi:molybdate transport system substrate-binding protein [Methanomicrobium sp. W14]|uniref:molybdate ABC transporter substrate-binding protein n=1 Tax=Methanomicrobium sp. W14 TaxID=2817839 RepID=UPI001AE7B6C5|nr:molybdate ABC transporter substrate-binding protein [Methanomicrobium sp. W14]MBP2134151.1 molybdate transport system substrate-binding protein [Methanomicrobium sp. W14]